MEYKGCVVVQGKTDLYSVKEIKRCFSGYQIIFSCWEGDDMRYYEEGDIVLLNPLPKDYGPQNYHLQRLSTIAGMEKAKELGWNRALKWRSDMWCVDGDKLFEKFEKDLLNLYFWVENLHGYITDFFMEGEIDDIITLFSGDIPQWKYNYPEFAITLQFFRNGLDKKAVFMGKLLDKECDIYWPKNRIWFTQHKADYWFVNVLPNNWREWIPTQRGKPINLFG